MSPQIAEILAPAGSINALRAAVNAGADAVYLAGQRFGARHYANNFALEEIEDALSYSHLRGVKVYVTVNTLLKDEELPEVADYLYWLYEKGVDGVIVQDIGVASLARDIVPHLPLHASTQMTIHNAEGIKWAADFGFQRVILAREMKLSQIEKIPSELSERIELEVFVHGAICYSYSGQCLFSSLIGGRSGNRGMCAQPCRKKYQLVSGKKDVWGKPLELKNVPMQGDYLLSTRDLAIYPYLDRLLNSNVSSLKIEGRMRSPEYVAVVVNIYRKALDSIKGGNWTPDQKDIEDLKLAFNRGFTRGHIMDAPPHKTMEPTSPGNRGLYLGKVVKVDKKVKLATVAIESIIRPGKGDGLVFINPETSARVFGKGLDATPTVDKSRVNFKVPDYVEKGFDVFMTRKASLKKRALDMIDSDYDDLLVLDVQMKWDKDLFALLQGEVFLKDTKILDIEYQANFAMEPAQKRPLSKNIIREQFLKTGGTFFTIRRLKIDYPGGLFCPISGLNRLRREFLLEVKKQLIEAHRPGESELKTSKKNLIRIKEDLDDKLAQKSTSTVPNLSVWVDNQESFSAAADAGCHRIYFQAPISSLGKTKSSPFLKLMKKFVDLIRDSKTELVWKLPLIIDEGYSKNFNPLMEELFDWGVRGVMVDGWGALPDENQSPLKWYGSTGLNVWNHLTVKELSGRFDSLTASPELSKDDLRKLVNLKHLKSPNINLEIMVQGNLEVLISEGYLGINNKNKNLKEDFWGLKDHKGHIFPINWDYKGRTRLLNSVELCLIDHLPPIMKMGLNGIVIDARGKPGRYTEEMILKYTKALELTIKKPPHLAHELKILKGDIKKISTGGITSGNFLRGISN
ncbi:MAG: U32 family peptidase [Methanobacteriaceae archaeon]|nr:U32 family peptidase [Methanobacteriaceae archaeon]